MELLIIALIIGIAAIYLIITLYGRIRKPSCPCGCEKCPLEKEHTCKDK
jgi:hypothetical protein